QEQRKERKRTNDLGLEIVRRLNHYFKDTDQKALREVVDMFQFLARDGDVVKKTELGKRIAFTAKLNRLSARERQMFMSVLDSIIKETAAKHGYKEDEAREVINNFSRMSL
ncbi:hypothetical protein PMAYCL1PPCAC_09453, partial [Pristionchus mayeri]